MTDIPTIEKDMLGGRGLNSTILWSLRDRIPDHWRSGKNIVVIGAGPFAGSTFPSSGRTTISVLKSPVTGFWSDGNLGGYFGPAMRRAGIAAIVLYGKLSKPHYIHINKNGLILLKKIEPENRFESLGTNTTEAWLTATYADRSDKVAVLALGTAAAKGVFCAVPISNNRAAGGGGTGAVIASKKIKAIMIEYEAEGDSINHISETTKARFISVGQRAEEKIKSHPVFDMFSKYGTTSLIEIHAALDYLPVNNWNQNMHEDWAKVSGQQLRDDNEHFYRTSRNEKLEDVEEKLKDEQQLGCSNCPICCSSIGKIEYETLNCLGPKIGVFNLQKITHWNALYMNDAGMDVIQSTSIIAALMNMWEDRVLDYEFNWGDEKLIQTFLEELSGPLLPEYASSIAKVFFNGFYDGILRILTEDLYHVNMSNFEKVIVHDEKLLDRLYQSTTPTEIAQLLVDYYYVHTKGYGLSGVYINEKNKGVALAAATSTRGADHLRSLPTLATYADWYLGGNAPTSLWEKLKRLFKMPLKALLLIRAEQKNLVGDLYKTYETTFGVPKEVSREWKMLGFLHDKEQTSGWGSMLKFCQEMYAVSDSLGTCKFTSTWRFGVGPEILAEALSLVSRTTYDWKSLLRCGERATAIERQLLFFYTIGTEVVDDIPQKFYRKTIKEPLTRERMSELLDDYYSRCGFTSSGSVQQQHWHYLFSQQFMYEVTILRDILVNNKSKGPTNE
jgi:aldehyde:ferredoxin oxidoreductase